MLLLLLTEFIVSTPPCVDDDTGCKDWARGGECRANRAFMEERCKASCGQCGIDVNSFAASIGSSWSQQRLSNLKAALDPDGDGYVSYEDVDALASIFTADRPSQTSPASGLVSRSASRPNEDSAGTTINLQENLQSGITFLRGRPPHVDGKNVNQYERSQYYFRAVSKDEAVEELTASERSAFECCAALCLSPEFAFGQRCWFIQTYKQDCIIHTGLWKMTSRTCQYNSS